MLKRNELYFWSRADLFLLLRSYLNFFKNEGRLLLAQSLGLNVFPTLGRTMGLSLAQKYILIKKGKANFIFEVPPIFLPESSVFEDDERQGIALFFIHLVERFGGALGLLPLIFFQTILFHHEIFLRSEQGGSRNIEVLSFIVSHWLDLDKILGSFCLVFFKRLFAILRVVLLKVWVPHRLVRTQLRIVLLFDDGLRNSWSYQRLCGHLKSLWLIPVLEGLEGENCIILWQNQGEVGNIKIRWVLRIYAWVFLH